MELNNDIGTGHMLKQALPHMQIDPKKARFPCCIVWTPLPIVSWLVPFIGHIGICREDGVILDFAGPNFVSVDNFAFGAVARYIQLNREQCFFPLSSPHACQDRHKNGECGTEMTWDDALRMGTQEFQHRSYNLFTCNCHSYVANSLNRVGYGGHNRWNVVNLAIMIFFKAQWVNKVAILRSFLPFVLVLSLGLLFVGWPFLIALAAFCFSLVGWFLFGTYCVKNLIHL